VTIRFIYSSGHYAGNTLIHPGAVFNKYALLTTKSPHPTQNVLFADLLFGSAGYGFKNVK